MKNRWLLYVVLFLLAVNAALLSVYLIDSRSDKIEVKSERKDGKERGRSKHSFEYHLAQELGFSEQQKSNVSAYRDDFKSKRKVLRSDLKELRIEYFQLLSQESVDTTKLRTVADNIGLLEAKKIKMEYEHYLNIRSVCTPEQAILMDSLGRVHMSKHFKFKDSRHERRRDCSESEKSNNKTNKNEK